MYIFLYVYTVEEGVIEDVDFSTELSLKDLEDSFITLVPPSPTLPSTNQIREAENKVGYIYKHGLCASTI